jgi:hypothetical protein
MRSRNRTTSPVESTPTAVPRASPFAKVDRIGRALFHMSIAPSLAPLPGSKRPGRALLHSPIR